MYVYKVVCNPYIMYFNTVWATAYQSKLCKLQRLKKRALRICSNAKFYPPSMPLFHSLNTLYVYDTTELSICMIMHRYFSNTLPEYLMEMFSLNLDVHNYDTRNRQLFHKSRVTSHSLYKSIRYTGPNMWNSLPPSLRNIQFLNSFKIKYKFHLLSFYV